MHMNELIDKSLLLICSLILYFAFIDTPYAVIPVLITVCLSSLCMYFDKPRIQILFYFLYLFICFIYPNYLLFLPLMLYDILFTELQFALFSCFILFGVNFKYYQPMLLLFIFLFCGICYILKMKSQRLEKLLTQYYEMRNTAAELSLVQEEKNRSILENQDYEINVATLNERNRISKEIHDHIGHLLSRSLLQIGALLTIAGEGILRAGLEDLKESLSEGMDSIRASIHNMHDESIDLYGALTGLVKEFTFCPVAFEYDLHNPPLLKLKYCLIAIVKESLSNIAKHSNADKVTLVLKEQPGMYQISIADNGKITDRTTALIRRSRLNGEYTDGMGLQSICDRVNGFNGNINITTDGGFKIFITIPKIKDN